MSNARFVFIWAVCWAAAGAGAGAPLDWVEGDGFRSARLAETGQAEPGFTSIAASESGVTFANRLPLERGLTNQILFSGSGVAAGDVDGDGWCDLFFASVNGESALFRNLGNWRFERMEESGIVAAGRTATGAVLMDTDGDRDLDLLLTTLGEGVLLFLNDGRGRFRDATEASGLAGAAASMTLTLADIEGDGDLDLYVANYRTDTLQDKPNTRFRISTGEGTPRILSVDGQPAAAPELRNRYLVNPATGTVVEQGEADALFINEGGGRFARAAWDDGRFLDEDGRPAATPYDWGLTAMFRDINGDHAPDLYVCNDGDSIDRIWINDGRGRFRAIPRLALRKTCFSSMGVDFADVNRDGWDDGYVTDMLGYEHTVRHTQMVDRRPLPGIGVYDDRPAYMQNTLFLNRGDGTYAEIAFLSGLEASDWSWMPLFIDVDLDGFEDLLVTSGLPISFRDSDARREIARARGMGSFTEADLARKRAEMPPLNNPNHAFRNRGDLTFEQVSSRWGFASAQVSHGMALADLDNDGDQDVVVNCMNAPALLYRNDAAHARVAVRLKGRAANTRGIGARLTLHGGPVQQSQEMIAGGRYLSSDDALRVFAGDAAGYPMRLEVVWRSGERTVLTNVLPNHLYEIDERSAKPYRRPAPMNQAVLFEDASALLAHRHAESAFDDFARQPLLEKQLDRLGPSVAWYDVNDDGAEDLLIGDGRGGELGVFLSSGEGTFRRLEVAEVVGRNLVDNGMVLGWTPSAGQGSFLVALSNYEGGGTNVPAALRFMVDEQGARQAGALPGGEAAVGPMALGDLDGDRDLDLIVGGRVVPGRYPEAASSAVYLNEQSGFRLDERRSAALRRVGLVSAVTLTDLTEDGRPELVLACEWGPVRIYSTDDGGLREVTKEWGLEAFRGWWNGVAAGDLDGDGRMDLVVSNWGRNHRDLRYASEPLRVYFGDLNGDGTVQLIRAYYDSVLGKNVPWAHWDELSAVLPSIQARWPTFAAYSRLSVEEIMGDEFLRLSELRATVMDSMLFLNRGGRFEARALPVEAQFAPAFGVNVGDLDGDGAEDVFLSQNFFAVDRETARHDAGRGLLLKGNGRGGLTAVRALVSGIKVYGEQRASALCDYDADGRVDLVVTQNGAETKLYHNRVARPGLRVRIQGPPGNLTGVGTVIRLKSGDRLGPAREVRAGSGYWSQDAAVQVMTMPGEVSGIWVRWPGGRVNEAELPKGAREVVLDSSGRMAVVE